MKHKKISQKKVARDQALLSKPEAKAPAKYQEIKQTIQSQDVLKILFVSPSTEIPVDARLNRYAKT